MQLCKKSAAVHFDLNSVEANDSGEPEWDMKCWYAVSTKMRSEATACASLDRLGIEVFLPMIRERKALRGKSGVTTSPLFPGYLFAKFDASRQFRAVAYAQGVKNIVTFGHGPSVVDDSIIQAIRGQAISGAIEFSETRFSPGQSVRIQDGPLCGLEAVFEKKLDGTSRAVLLLKAISFQARVILESQLVANM
jgi:transcriptional antiterminator RfaH